MPNKTLTIMFTDMREFTSRTSAISRDQVVNLVREQQNILLPVARTFNGTLVKTIGDGLLIVFESATDAVLAGIAMQRCIVRHNQNTNEGAPIEVRIGINTGEASLVEQDVFGESVNIAARILSISEPGEVFFSEATYLAMNKAEVSSADLGFRVLKGIPEHVRIFKVSQGRTRKHTSSGVRIPERQPLICGASVLSRGIAFSIDLVIVTLLSLLLNRADFIRVKALGEDLLSRTVNAAPVAANRIGIQSTDRVIYRTSDTGRLSGQDRAQALRSSVDDDRKAKVLSVKILLRSLLLTVPYCMFFFAVFASTPGKFLLGLRVFVSDGTSTVFWRRGLRGLLYILSILPFGLGFFVAWFDPFNRTLHDRLSGTIVAGKA